MHSCSNINPVSEHTEQDSICSAFTKKIGKQSGVARLFSDSIHRSIKLPLQTKYTLCLPLPVVFAGDKVVILSVDTIEVVLDDAVSDFDVVLMMETLFWLDVTLGNVEVSVVNVTLAVLVRSTINFSLVAAVASVVSILLPVFPGEATGVLLELLASVDVPAEV